MNGTVRSFDAVDSLGWIVLDDGREVRFGLTACKRLSPTPGLRVRVELREEGSRLKAVEVRSASWFGARSAARPANAPLDRFDFASPDAHDRGMRAGFLLQWLILNRLVSAELEARAAEPLARVRAGALTGRRFITEVCDERPMRADLSPEGLAFWEFAYGKPSFFVRRSRLEAELDGVGLNEAAALAVIDALRRRQHQT
jgi:hypothetical protein